MVDLPAPVNGVPSVHAPQSHVSPGQIASPYQELAANLDKAGEIVSKDIAVPLAEREAPASVTLDKDGQPIVSQRPIIVGEAAQAYARAARTTALNRAEPDILEKATKFRLEHPGDPDAVKKAGAAYVNEIVAKQSDPLLKSALQIAGERAIGTSVRTSIVEADHINTRNFLATSEARLTSLNDKAVALARQPGGVDTPEYAQTVADRGAIYKELVNDPRAKYPPARAAQEIAEQAAMEKGQAVIGHVVEQYKTSKNAPAARKALMDWAWGPGSEKLSLSEQKRNHIVSEGVGALDRVGAEDTVERTEFRSGLGKYIQGVMTAPSTFNDIAHNGYMKKALELNDAKSVGDLNALRTVQPLADGIKRLPTEQAVLALKQLDQGIVPKIEGAQGELPLRAGSSVFDQSAPVMRLFETATQELRGHLGSQVEHMTASLIKDLSGDKPKDVSPQEIATFVAAVQATGRNDLIPKLDEALRASEGRRGLQVGGSSAAVAAQFEALARSGEDPVKRALHSAIAAGVVKDAANLQKDALTEMGARGWAPAPRPLPLDDAQGAAVELRSRDQALAVGRTLDKSLGPKSAILPGEIDGVTATLTQGPVQQAQGILDAMKILSPEVYKETAAALKDGLVGMSRSADPARMALGMSVLDNLWRTDAPEFTKTYGADTATRLAAFNGLKTAFNKEEIAMRLNRADDPSLKTAREKTGEEVDEELKNKKPADVAYQLGSAWPILNTATFNITGSTPGIPANGLTARAMQADYDTTYKALRQYGVDKDQANALTIQRMKDKWGPTQLAGNRLMKNPPESHYPKINGSHDWMQDALSELITSIKGEPMAELGAVPPSIAKAANLGIVKGLISDAQTEAEIAAGKPPSYQIAITNPHGMDEILTDKDGKGRFAFDPRAYQAAFDKAFGRMDQHRKANRDLTDPDAARAPFGVFQ